MLADQNRTTSLARPVPPHSRRPVGDRLVRQVEAIDAWNAARRRRESLLEAACASRLDREAANRQVDVLRRTQHAIATRTAWELAREAGPLPVPAVSVVIVHRHAWWADKVASHLAARRVSVVECTDNGADALGAVIAEQPDIVLAGDRFEMMTVDMLLAEIRLFAPSALCALQAGDQRQARALQARVDAVFQRNDHLPGDVADALITLYLSPTRTHERV